MTSVPCNGCTVCCKDQIIHLMPGDEPAAYDTRDVWNPVLGRIAPALKQRANGDCVYLENNQCSIHDRAPQVCKTFDCRRFVKSFGDRTAQRRAVREKELEPKLYAAARERMHTLKDD